MLIQVQDKIARAICDLVTICQPAIDASGPSRLGIAVYFTGHR